MEVAMPQTQLTQRARFASKNVQGHSTTPHLAKNICTSSVVVMEQQFATTNERYYTGHEREKKKSSSANSAFVVTQIQENFRKTIFVIIVLTALQTMQRTNIFHYILSFASREWSPEQGIVDIVSKYRATTAMYSNLHTASWIRHAGLYKDTDYKESRTGRTATTAKYGKVALQAKPRKGPEEYQHMIWDDEDDIDKYFERLTGACEKSLDTPGSVEDFYKSCWGFLHDLIQVPRCTTTLDSRTDCKGRNTTINGQVIDTVLGPSHFSADTINVVILGAGPVGLFLANALMELQERDSHWFIEGKARPEIRVTVFENRILSDGMKKLYSRDWMTDLAKSYLYGALDPRILEILDILFPQALNLNLPIMAIETLLLLSCRDVGVKFIYGDYTEYMDLLNNVPNSIIFDASGHRLEPLDRGENMDGSFSSDLWKAETEHVYDEIYAFHGMSASHFEKLADAGSGLNLIMYTSNTGDSLVYPSFGDKGRYAIYFLKIKFSSPIGNDLYEKISTINGTAPPLCIGPGLKKDWATSWCGPHFYYDMSGNYRSDISKEMRSREPEFNFRIGLLNMDRVQMEYVTNLINNYQDDAETKEVSLFKFKDSEVANIPDAGKNGLSDIIFKIRELHSKVAANGWSDPAVSTFVYRPYIYADSLVSGTSQWTQAPLLRVGDSFLTGDPNASTGLQTHFAIIRHFQCMLWDLESEICKSPGYPKE